MKQFVQNFKVLLIHSKRTLLSIALVLAAAASSRAALIRVPADYSTIQAAIDAAVAGDEIKIAAGVYTEQVVITNKSLLTLSGSPGSILRATPGLQPSLAALGSIRVPLVGIGLSEDVVVSGLTLEGERSGDSQPGPLEGIHFDASSGRVEDCRITGFRGGTSSLVANGVFVVNPIGLGTGIVHVEVIGSTFADNRQSITLVGDLPTSGSGNFDPTVLRTTFVVKDNTVVGNGPETSTRQFGVYIQGGARGEVIRNIITGHSYVGTADPMSPFSFGILGLDNLSFTSQAPLQALQPVKFEGNVLRDNQIHFALFRGDGSSIVNNSFEGRGLGYRPGGLYLSGENMLVATNRFSDLETGILLIGNDPDFGTYLGIASNATLISNGFCEVDTTITAEPLTTHSEQGTLITCLPPSLSIRAIQLSWPYAYQGYLVETAPNANGPWTASDALVFPQNGQNNALVPTDGTQRFFRLQHP